MKHVRILDVNEAKKLICPILSNEETIVRCYGNDCMSWHWVGVNGDGYCYDCNQHQG
jgi:hypothetical protein